MTLKSALLSLQSLLCSPEPRDPQDAVVAQHYLSDRKGFDETARYWTQMYASPDGQASGSGAKPPPPPRTGASAAAAPAPAPAADRARLSGIDPQHADQFAAMGFDRERVIDVLCVHSVVDGADRPATRSTIAGATSLPSPMTRSSTSSSRPDELLRTNVHCIACPHHLHRAEPPTDHASPRRRYIACWAPTGSRDALAGAGRLRRSFHMNEVIVSPSLTTLARFQCATATATSRRSA